MAPPVSKLASASEDDERSRAQARSATARPVASERDTAWPSMHRRSNTDFRKLTH